MSKELSNKIKALGEKIAQLEYSEEEFKEGYFSCVDELESKKSDIRILQLAVVALLVLFISSNLCWIYLVFGY